MKGSRVEQYWSDKVSSIGNVQYRNTKTERTHDVNYDYRDVLTKFGIKNTEFGNWMSVADREDRLEALRDGLREMAVVVGFDNIGFDGQLAICFGGRGHGGRFAGHFEPWDNVINLSKTHKGVFVHEWAHAADYIVGGGLVQDKKGFPLTAGGDAGLRILADEIVSRRRQWKLPSTEYFQKKTEIFARTVEDWYSHQVRCRETDIMCKDVNFYEHYSVVYMTEEARREIFPLVDLFFLAMRVVLGEYTVKDAEKVNKAVNELRAKRLSANKVAAKNPEARQPAKKAASKKTVAKKPAAKKPAQKAASRKSGSQLKLKFQ